MEDAEGESSKYTSEICVAKGSVKDMSAPTRNFDRSPYHLGDNRYYLQIGNVKLTSSTNKFSIDSIILTRKPPQGKKGKDFSFHTPLRFIDQMFNSLGDIMGYDMTTFQAEPKKEGGKK